MLKRRDFFKVITPVVVAAMLPEDIDWKGVLLAAPSTPDRYDFKTPFYHLGLSRTAPEITALCLDSLGKGKLSVNPILPQQAKTNRAWQATRNNHSITYSMKSNGSPTKDCWTFQFAPKHIVIRSMATAGALLDPLVVTFKQLAKNNRANHATLLGRMEKSRQQMRLPCVLHMPDLGTARITCNVEHIGLGYDAQRRDTPQFVEITFPPATAQNPIIEYTLEITAIYPKLPGIEKDPRYDGFRRNFLNIFQINPRFRALANNASSDVVASAVYEYAMVAAKCPPLAQGLTCLDILRDTLDRYCDGMLAYGLVGYGANYEGVSTAPWDTPYDALDAMPSLLIAACTYIQASEDWKWAADRLTTLNAWGFKMLESDNNPNGLIEYPLSGNHGCYSTRYPFGTSYDQHQPSNAWDTIGFGHEDAYSNALAYRACVMMEQVVEHIGHHAEAEFFRVRGSRIRAAYFRTFFNPQTGLLAGWKSSDGQLHDYQFTFVNSVAVWSGVLDQRQAAAVMRQLLAKMKTAGYSFFRLGLPGNLIPVAIDDYALGTPGAGAFQVYCNGGATPLDCYFTIEALFRTGMAAAARRILYPMLESFESGSFQGVGADGMTKDWKNWNGQCFGYEGFLVDGYLTLLAVLTDRNAAQNH